MNGTLPYSINPAGTITGNYYDANFVGHGFLRAANGTLVSFDAPGAGTTGAFPGTYPVSINPAGTIVGMYTDANSLSHGFVRASDGTFTTFDPPGQIAAFAPFALAQTLYINPDGVITGAYFDPFRETPSGAIFVSSCGPLMALSPHSMQRPIPLAVYGRFPPVLPRRTRSPDPSMMALPLIMASCAPGTVP